MNFRFNVDENRKEEAFQSFRKQWSYYNINNVHRVKNQILEWEETEDLRSVSGVLCLFMLYVYVTNIIICRFPIKYNIIL